MERLLWGIAIGVAVVAVLLLVLFLFVRGLVKREPYRSFMALRTMAKLRFFKSILTDRRVPLRVKVVPVLTVLYLSMPFDLLPDFIPVLGYMDDLGIVVLALSAVIAMTPQPVVDDLLREAAGRQDPSAPH